MYSNSSHDAASNQEARAKDEISVRSMYEHAPYPGLGAGLKDMGLFLRPIEQDLRNRERVRFLDAGCGTGHYLVGVAKKHPNWDCFGIDLSQGSLDIAAQLSAMHEAPVTLNRASYLDPLPYEEKFDVISALGTVHHSANPVTALRRLSAALKDDGYLLMHVYGLRIDREKFDIKEMLSIFQPDLTQIDDRFRLYDALMRHRSRNWPKRLVQMSLIDIYAMARVGIRNFFRRRRQEVWSPPFTDRFTSPTAPWIDHFCHPCERAYEVPDVAALLRDSGLEVVHMLGQGREYPQLIPPDWLQRYQDLSIEQKWRLSELLAFRGGSFRMILRKIRTAG